MNGRRKLLLVAGAVGAFLLVSASSCATNQLLTGNGLPTLEFAGDSITVQATAAINAHYASNYDVAIHAIVGGGAATSNGSNVNISNWVAEQAATDPAAEVINIGT